MLVQAKHACAASAQAAPLCLYTCTAWAHFTYIMLAQQPLRGAPHPVPQTQIGNRLETLESGLQEIAEKSSQQAAGYGGWAALGLGAGSADQAASSPGPGGGAPTATDPATEFMSMRDRLGTLERRAEALWHEKEGSQELRALADRLRADLDTLRESMGDTQVGAGRVHMCVYWGDWRVTSEEGLGEFKH